MRARRATIRLAYNGRDISRDIEQDLIGFRWEDNASGKADSISISLKNDHGRWAEEWLPGTGDTLEAWIISEQGGRVEQLYCGRFSIDDLEFQYPERTLTTKGVSVPLDNTVRRTKKSKAWEDASLQDVAQAIADGAGLGLLYDVQAQVRYDRVDQTRETDLRFLDRLCSDAGCSLKVTDSQIIVFETAAYEDRDPSASVALGDSQLISASFEMQAYDAYSTVIVSYYDSTADELVEATVHDKHVVGGMTARLSKRAKSLVDARRLAEVELARLNRYDVTGKFSLLGGGGLVAAATLEVSGFGAMSGKYIIDTAVHDVAGGYTVAADARRVAGGG